MCSSRGLVAHFLQAALGGSSQGGRYGTMATRLSVALVTLSVIATGLLGVAGAIPAGGLNWVGPRPLDACTDEQELGFAGNPDGSAGGTGANGYHSYANDPSGIILDSCLSDTDVLGFPACASAE